MLHTLDQIKALRTKYHLNQKKMADLAGVSQSLIAKIEAGKVDPSFTKAKQILDALDRLQGEKEVKAKEIMNSKVIVVQSSELVKDIIKTMKNKGISQVPVFEKEKVVGIISETTILNSLAEHLQQLHHLKAKEVMESVPPIVSPDTGLKTLMHLLQEFSIVLVAEKGDIKGIISKTDLLGKME